MDWRSGDSSKIFSWLLVPCLRPLPRRSASELQIAFLLSELPNGFQKPRFHGLCGHQLQERGVRQAICRDVSQRPKVLQISAPRQINSFRAPLTASIGL